VAASSGDNAIQNWPEPCKCSAYEPILRLSDLPDHAKALVWCDLKKNNPKKAENLVKISQDQIVKDLILEFSASPTLVREDLSKNAYDAVKGWFE
jgi:hypothetical protein